MKQRPILFSTPMVAAIMAGRKTNTRRTKGLEEINKNPDDWMFEWADFSLKKPFRFTQKSSVTSESLANRNFYQAEAKCPYGKVGDMLWVRETFNIDVVTKEPYFKASKDTWAECYREHDVSDLEWKPSLFMPKDAARIWLKITGVRVERLQDISRQDAISEGIESGYTVNRSPGAFYKNYYPENNGGPDFANPIWSFESLWQSINGPESWSKNPWVWVVSFVRIEKPI